MITLAKQYKQLNAEQAKAVDMVDGPLLVLAGPGTGKTQLLSVRAALIVSRGKAAPEHILMLTYTNAAVKAMRERLFRILGPQGYNVAATTFHSFANTIIQESEEAINYTQEKIQISDVEKVKAIEYILDTTGGLEEIRPFGAPYLYRKEIAGNIRDLKNEGISPQRFAEFVSTLTPDEVYIQQKHLPRLKAFSTVYRLYEELKKGQTPALFDERGRYDYEDMIIIAREALKKERLLKDKYRQQYKYIMVDEFQDTNGAQLDLLFSLIGRAARPNLCCVGDDDQSIFRFQGASVGNFKFLKKKFPGITVVSLGKNYRSTGELIDLSTRIIHQVPSEHRTENKQLLPQKDYKNKSIAFYECTTEDEEITFLVSKIEQLKKEIEQSDDLDEAARKHPYDNIALLVRKREYIVKIVDAFLRAGIPYATDAKENIGNEKRVRQMLDVLRLAHIDIRDVSAKDLILYKVLTADYFGIPHSDILRFIGFVNEKKDTFAEKNLTAQKGAATLLGELLHSFPVDEKAPPAASATKKLPIVTLLQLRRPHKIHMAVWALLRLIREAGDRPVHDILMQFIKDVRLYSHILKLYGAKKVIKMRDLRALTSFVNMIKNTDLSSPGLGLAEFMEEIALRAKHAMPLVGQLVTATQYGVKIYTAHGTKGLEFHTIIIPFCLQDKSWPVRPLSEKIPLPAALFKTRERPRSKAEFKNLCLYDETRLFYVAATRAKSNLIFTASPSERAMLTSYASALRVRISRPPELPEERILSDFLDKKGDIDPFSSTDDVLKDMARNIVLTPTKLNNYLRCRRKFLYDNVLKLPGPKRQSLVFGNCAHKALEEVYKKYLAEISFPNVDYFIEQFNLELKRQGVNRSVTASCKNKLGRIIPWFRETSKHPVRPLGLENKIIATIGEGIVFTGKYDKVETDDAAGNTVNIVDYKTGAPDKHIRALARTKDVANENCDDYLRQLVAYKLLYENDKKASGGRKVRHGVLDFLEPIAATTAKYGLRKGTFRKEKILISDDQVRRLTKVIIDSWHSIQQLQFEKLPERDQKKCGACDFNEICWE